jgi:protein-S-isoprenylcysteine O-methyltransferase Ste14
MDLSKAVRDPWVWGQLALVLLIGIAGPLLPRYINLGDADFMVNRVDPAWIRWLGAVLMGAGALMMVWGARSLGKNLTPGTEPMAGAELVTTGAYAHRRHPIYGGAVLLLTGYVLAWSNWTLALLTCLLTTLFFNSKARREEEWLLARFPAYRAYLRHVHRTLL